MTTAAPRRRAGKRISSALWGLLVIGAGVLSIAAYSGYEIDLQLAAIILLAAVGGWLLLSAAFSGLGRKREVARATAPVVEEPREAWSHHPAPAEAPDAEAPAEATPEEAAPEEASSDDAEPDEAPDAEASDEGGKGA